MIRTVRQDDQGLYLTNNGVRVQPGAVQGWTHAIRMDDGGLGAGDRVSVRICENGLQSLKLPDGTRTFWTHRLSYTECEPPKDAVWDANGYRIFR